MRTTKSHAVQIRWEMQGSKSNMMRNRLSVRRCLCVGKCKASTTTCKHAMTQCRINLAMQTHLCSCSLQKLCQVRCMQVAALRWMKHRVEKNQPSTQVAAMKHRVEKNQPSTRPGRNEKLPKKYKPDHTATRLTQNDDGAPARASSEGQGPRGGRQSEGGTGAAQPRPGEKRCKVTRLSRPGQCHQTTHRKTN